MRVSQTKSETWNREKAEMLSMRQEILVAVKRERKPVMRICMSREVQTIRNQKIRDAKEVRQIDTASD